MPILIIAEKPSVAKRIASSFGNASMQMNGKIPYYEINLKDTKDKQKIYVCSAVGHLYEIAQKNKNYDYPVFDVEWRAAY